MHAGKQSYIYCERYGDLQTRWVALLQDPDGDQIMGVDEQTTLENLDASVVPVSSLHLVLPAADSTICHCHFCTTCRMAYVNSGIASNFAARVQNIVPKTIAPWIIQNLIIENPAGKTMITLCVIGSNCLSNIAALRLCFARHPLCKVIQRLAEQAGMPSWPLPIINSAPQGQSPLPFVGRQSLLHAIGKKVSLLLDALIAVQSRTQGLSCP